MDQWDGKVAVVTGASSDIGEAISQCLVSHGLTVVGVGRRFDALKKIADQQRGKKGKFYPKAININNEAEVVTLFKTINNRLGGVHILINCAGVCVDSSLIDGKTSDWKNVLHIQLVALSLCTREAIRSMKRAMNDGVIIHINSAGGRYIPEVNIPPMLTTAKHGITVLAEILRKELTGQKLHIKVTSLSPGFVKTKKIAATPAFKNKPLLELQDVCDAVTFILSTPQNVEISELIITSQHSDF